MGRIALHLVTIGIVLLAGCQAPTPATDGVGPPAMEGASPDGSSDDRLGWERGYGANDSLAIDETDGLNASERAAVVARAMARVERLRGIEFDEAVNVTVISREAYRSRSGGSRDVPAARRAAVNARYEALFLIGEDRDAIAVRQALFGSVVAGLYRPGADSIVIVSETETPMIAEPILAHELVHALQFRHLEAGNLSARTTDGAFAIDGLIEGDAGYVDALYADRCASEWECVRPEGDDGNASRTVRTELFYLAYFPYSDGPVFVEHFREIGGWDRVNELYGAPPESAEQVIDPRRYGNGSPSAVPLPDASTAAWDPVTTKRQSWPDTLGQPAIAAMFMHPTVDDREGQLLPVGAFTTGRRNGTVVADPYAYDFDAADGWDGDAFRVYKRDDGELAYVWRIAWDSRADAREFAAVYRDLLSYWGGERVPGATGRWHIPDGESPYADAFSVRVEGDTVTIVNAPSVSALSAVHPRASNR